MVESVQGNLNPPSKPLRLLIVEDEPADAELCLRELKKAGLEVCSDVVSTAKDFLARLAAGEYDIILADYKLPGWSGLEALQSLRTLQKEMPFLIVTGELGDETVAELVRVGVTDYIIKDRMARLPLAIIQALEEKELREKNRKIETPSSKPVRALYLEDSRADAELSLHILKKAGFEMHADIVGTREEFTARLSAEAYDVIICDQNLPAWTGIEAFEHSQALGFDIPVILVTGSLSDETAAEFAKRGLTDYVLKDRLARLPLVLARSLEQKALREHGKRFEANYRSLVERAPYGIFQASLDGKLLMVNPALVEMLGYQNAEEILGVNLFADINQEGESAWVEQCHKGEPVDGVEALWYRKDGTPLTVRLSSRPVQGTDGAAAYSDLIAENITDRKQLEAQLRQSQKMEAIGRLAGGIAHDFNNLLTIILGYAQLAQGRLGPDHPLGGAVEEIKKAGERAASLTRQLLAFGRRQVLMPQVLDLNAVTSNMDRMLRRLIGEDVELVTVAGPDLGRVKADPGQIEQVIMNLAVNARDAMPRGGKLLIETANVTLDAAYADRHADTTPGSYVVLAVSDTGVGMSPEIQAHIFEPFFTTKEKGKGTGLGLATVYGIVKQSGGHIWVYSEPGRGTSFKIYFPRISEEVSPQTQPSRQQAAESRGSETILVVEDEGSLRAMVQGVLESQGYQVMVARSGEDALEVLKQHTGRVDLLLTDMVMPGMDGKVLADHLSSFYRSLKILFMSGYTDNGAIFHGGLKANAAFLQKPFSPEALSSKVREVLDSPPARREAA